MNIIFVYYIFKWLYQNSTEDIILKFLLRERDSEIPEMEGKFKRSFDAAFKELEELEIIEGCRCSLVDDFNWCDKKAFKKLYALLNNFISFFVILSKKLLFI